MELNSLKPGAGARKARRRVGRGIGSGLGKTAGRDQALSKATYAALLGVDRARLRALSEADSAVAALRAAGLQAPALEALARYAAERDR